MNIRKFIISTVVCSFICFVSCQSQTGTTTKDPNQVNCTDCNLKDAAGKKYGLWIEDNGLREVYYKDDQRDGIYKTYYRKNGKLSCLGEYKEGNKTGIWYYFNEKSQIVIIEKEISINTEISVKLDNGETIIPKFKSYVIRYYPNGIIKEEGIALNNGDIEIDFIEYGVWKYYDKTGKLVKTETK